jgi:beta-lactam-binding protein with PASTA domain
MNAILYGNLSVEIASRHGARVTRVTLRQNPFDLLHRRRPEALPRQPIFGREQQLADALRAIQQRRPIEFHADCGYGKTTLLEHIVAGVSERYSAAGCIYLQADRDRVEDLLQQLVTQLYRSDQPVKLTPGECAQLLGQAGLIIAVDDAPADPAQVGYLLDVLSGCTLVIGSARRVPVRGGSSHDLAGLPVGAALSLLAADLGRSLTNQELPAAQDLVAAVGGQPLHLKQAAALVNDGSHSIASLARQAAADPAALDRLSIGALTDRERRALAVLAFAAGALLPGEVVDVIGQVAQLGECLQLLHRRGLAEQRHDRFGLPVCKTESYRAMLLGDLQLGSSVAGLCSWLATRDPTASESLSGANAALAIMEFAAERRDWMAVVRLARAAEQILFIAARWEAWHHALSQGLAAAQASFPTAAEAFFSHQLGSLELCLDHLDEASRLLRHALALREQAGDRDGAELTRQNLRLLELPPAPAPPRPRVPRPVAAVLTAVLTVLGLVVGAVAIAGAVAGGGPSSPAPPPNSTGTSTGPGTSNGTGPGTSNGTATGTDNQVAVPDVIGQTRDQATSTLTGAGLTVVPTTTSNCNSTGTGHVVTQNPAGGASVGKGSSVAIGVCSPAATMVRVPNVIGQTQDQATGTLKGVGLTAMPATTSNCDRANNGNVVTQNPRGGASVGKGSSVAIAVCHPAATPVTVPNVVGQTRDQATGTLTGAGLTAAPTTTTTCDTTDNGKVVSQDPQGGTPADPGSRVTITVCGAKVTVPNVIGQTQDQATGTLRDVGLTADRAPTSDSSVCTTAQDGLVVSQDPQGGTPADPGSRVTITVCSAKVTVPNVIGQTQDQATGTLRDVGLTAAPTTNTTCDATDNGKVVSQDPQGGTPADPDSRVTINVCSIIS